MIGYKNTISGGSSITQPVRIPENTRNVILVMNLIVAHFLRKQNNGSEGIGVMGGTDDFFLSFVRTLKAYIDDIVGGTKYRLLIDDMLSVETVIHI